MAMQESISRIAIMTKADHQSAYELGWTIHAWLSSQGVDSDVFVNEERSKDFDLGHPRPDMILVIGGDGTIISVARQLSWLQCPLLGLNLGRVGFLTDLTPQNWSSTLKTVLEGRFQLSTRVMLQFETFRDNVLLNTGRVVNDLVVGRGGMARLIGLTLMHEGQLIGSFRADGLVVSTPLGSSAYAVAAGGSLIHPELDVFEICPVCPFMSNVKPMIVPSSWEISIKLEQTFKEAFLTQDGQSGWQLLPGDLIRIREAGEKLVFIQPECMTYFTRLRDKGYM